MKTVRNTLLIFLLFATGVVAAVGYSLYSSEKRALHMVLRAEQSRARELGTALSYVAAEKLSPGYLVGVASAMHHIVRDSVSRNGEIVVERIVLLDRNGKVLAHNDIALMAKNSGNDYKTEEYSQVFARSERNPIRMEPLEPVQEAGEWYYKPVLYYINRFHPMLAASRFHVSVAVFPVDRPFAEAGLHIFLKSRLVYGLLPHLLRTATSSLGVGLGVSFVISLLLALFLIRRTDSFAYRGAERARNREHPLVERYERERIPAVYEGDSIDDIEPVLGGEGFQAANEGSLRIMDAIPLDAPGGGSATS